MRIDAFAFETHFLDHLAPVWLAMPAAARGRFLVDATLAAKAVGLGIEAEAMTGNAIRRIPPRPAVAGADGPVALVASYGDTKVARRLGYQRFAFLEHGIGQSYGGDRDRAVARHGSYAGGDDRADVGLFLVPNDHSADRWRQAYPQASVVIVGSPKLDGLPRREPGPGPVVALSFHWPANICPETGSAFGEYRPFLLELAAAFTGRLIGHGHPRFVDRLGRYYRKAGIPLVDDFTEVCRQADVYVCDNSSSMYEFAATGRPVVVLNSRYYRRSIEHGLRFWEASGVGVPVASPDRVIAAIEEALEDAPGRQADREAALSIVYGQRTNGAATAATAILDWLAARAEVAA